MLKEIIFDFAFEKQVIIDDYMCDLLPSDTLMYFLERLRCVLLSSFKLRHPLIWNISWVFIFRTFFEIITASQC